MIPCKTCLIFAICKNRFKTEQFHIINNCDIICKHLILNSKKITNRDRPFHYLGKYGYQFLVNQNTANELYKLFYGSIPHFYSGGWGDNRKGKGKYTIDVDEHKSLFIGFMNTWNEELEDFEK